MNTINRSPFTIVLLLALGAGTLTYASVQEGQTMTSSPNALSRVSVIALGVTDLAKSIEFYSGTLGLPQAKRSGEIAFIETPTVTLLLSQPLGRSIKPATNSIEIVFPVDSVAATHRVLSQKGCSFIKQPGQMSSDSWAATFTDPDGHLLTIFGGR
jgi:catechol 2,3-dioxygenase-like lactoylglutathione lyase family enzyme